VCQVAALETSGVLTQLAGRNSQKSALLSFYIANLVAS